MLITSFHHLYLVYYYYYLNRIIQNWRTPLFHEGVYIFGINKVGKVASEPLWIYKWTFIHLQKIYIKKNQRENRSLPIRTKQAGL